MQIQHLNPIGGGANANVSSLNYSPGNPLKNATFLYAHKQTSQKGCCAIEEKHKLH
jgi:hypothetical protein